MSNEEKERRCKSCGKLLFDEKNPLCRRCVLEWRNKGVKGVEIVGSLAMAACGAVALKKNSDSNDDSTD